MEREEFIVRSLPPPITHLTQPPQLWLTNALNPDKSVARHVLEGVLPTIPTEVSSIQRTLSITAMLPQLAQIAANL